MCQRNTLASTFLGSLLMSLLLSAAAQPLDQRSIRPRGLDFGPPKGGCTWVMKGDGHGKWDLESATPICADGPNKATDFAKNPFGENRPASEMYLVAGNLKAKAGSSDGYVEAQELWLPEGHEGYSMDSFILYNGYVEFPDPEKSGAKELGARKGEMPGFSASGGPETS